jgi:putative oxidoreductase
MLAGLVEIVAGVLLALGLAAPLAAAVVLSVMMVAAVSVHARNGFFITEGGYEFNVVFGAAAWTIAFTGPGSYSLDAALGRATGGEVWGLTAFVVAAIGAGGQLAQRRPATQPAPQKAGAAGDCAESRIAEEECQPELHRSIPERADRDRDCGDGRGHITSPAGAGTTGS